MNKNLIRHQTVILIGKILHPLTESNLIPFPEYREIIAQLKHIAAKGEPLPVVVPKLVTTEEAANTFINNDIDSYCKEYKGNDIKTVRIEIPWQVGANLTDKSRFGGLTIMYLKEEVK